MPDLDLAFLGLATKGQRELGSLFSDLVNAGGDALESLVVFGSAAAEGYDYALSDINLAVVLARDDRDVLDAIKTPLSVMMRRFKVSAMVTTSVELATSADVFPVKFLNIKERHRVLFGSDPFTTMTIRRVHLRLRCEQELKNMSLKLRRSVVSRAATPTARRDMIRNYLPPFTTVLRTMLGMAGEPQSDDRAETLDQASRVFDLPSQQLEQLTELGWGDAARFSNDEIEDLAHAFLRIVARAAAVADEMPDELDES